MKVNLLLIGSLPSDLSWSLGESFFADQTPNAVQAILNIHLSEAEAWLFWSSDIPLPETDYILTLLDQRVDGWHAGLKLGMAGLPEWIDYVAPTWMFNCDASSSIEATSWRLSLQACLVRSQVIEQLGGISEEFTSLAAAGLELGHRWISNGAIMRHLPDLIPNQIVNKKTSFTISDEMQFINLRYGKKWLIWSALRAIFSKIRILPDVIQRITGVLSQPFQQQPSPYNHNTISPLPDVNENGPTSVIIPTLGRYPYLLKLLPQLAQQTFLPLEVIIIDQNPLETREKLDIADYPQLQIKFIYQDQSGQCTARNAGLNEAKGDFILFIDDDDEVPCDIIEKHLRTIQQYNCSVSSGVAHDIGHEPLPRNFTYFRLSDVFPTNNTLARKSCFKSSGLFDLAYNKGQNEDGDLGMRVYLSGELMVLNPEISVLHHHAPIGGLRHHKAHVHTYTASRQRITLRILTSVSEIYLARRYFTSKQVREMLWINVIGTFSVHGPWWKKIVKAIMSFLSLPFTLWQLHQRWLTTGLLLRDYPQIPYMEKMH